MNGGMELSALQIVSYLEGWGGGGLFCLYSCVYEFALTHNNPEPEPMLLA